MGDTLEVSLGGDLEEPERFDATPEEEDEETSTISTSSVSLTEEFWTTNFVERSRDFSVEEFTEVGGTSELDL